MMGSLPQIEHVVDVIEAADGSVDQYYNFLVYRFPTEPETVARHYLEDEGTVSVISSHSVPEDVLAYLRIRFVRVQQLGREGYVEIND